MSSDSANALQWSSEYELGHSIVDAQHKRLFQLYGAVCKAFNKGNGYEVVGPALERLASYTVRHFHDEEEVMREAGFSGLAEHRALHKELVQQVEELLADLKAGQPVMLYEVLAFLSGWLTNHILNEDMKLKELLAE